MESNKMPKPTITFHNTATGEIETREMNAAELAEHKALKERYEAQAAEAEAKATAKASAQAKLAALGLTVEDLQALGL
jgi:hypothetical protein